MRKTHTRLFTLLLTVLMLLSLLALPALAAETALPAEDAASDSAFPLWPIVLPLCAAVMLILIPPSRKK